MTCCDDDLPFLSRRGALKLWASGFGWLALRGILGEDSARAASLPRGAFAPQDAPLDPLAPKQPHFAPRAKRVIFLCMSGAPSHVDTFDYKPKLLQDTGKSYSGRFRAGAKLLGSPWKFERRGKSGIWMSELFPNLALQADDLCVLNGMSTDVPAHPQATLKLHTGSFQFVRPSLGSWTLYGLGTENRNVPGFVTLNAPAGQGGAQNYGAAFLPAYFQGQRVGVEGRGRGFLRARPGENNDPIEDISNGGLSIEQQRKQLDLVQKLNRERKTREGGDAVEGVIQSYELAFRMQAEVPGLLDISKETKATLDLYGVGGEGTDGFGRQCLLARRFVEAGVRFVVVNQGGWDHHRNLKQALPQNCAAIDRPIAGLLADLKKRGLLKDTLVLWGGEFGRTPYGQGDDGRDHNHKGFTMWMAGGGVKGGTTYGATDDYGAEAVDGRMSIHDLHATVLHLLGLDHEKLTFNYAGRDFRLTDVHGSVPREILA
jgi:hypothetical protein